MVMAEATRVRTAGGRLQSLRDMEALLPPPVSEPTIPSPRGPDPETLAAAVVAAVGPRNAVKWARAAAKESAHARTDPHLDLALEILSGREESAARGGVISPSDDGGGAGVILTDAGEYHASVPNRTRPTGTPPTRAKPIKDQLRQPTGWL